MVTRPPDACAWVAATQAKGMRCGACGAVRCGAVRCGAERRAREERERRGLGAYTSERFAAVLGGPETASQRLELCMCVLVRVPRSAQTLAPDRACSACRPRLLQRVDDALRRARI